MIEQPIHGDYYVYLFLSVNIRGITIYMDETADNGDIRWCMVQNLGINVNIQPQRRSGFKQNSRPAKVEQLETCLSSGKRLASIEIITQWLSFAKRPIMADNSDG